MVDGVDAMTIFSALRSGPRRRVHSFPSQGSKSICRKSIGRRNPFFVLAIIPRPTRIICTIPDQARNDDLRLLTFRSVVLMILDFLVTSHSPLPYRLQVAFRKR